jgi:prepilin-type N-terminal cleavage/methylation domain-containing protein
MRSRQAGYSLLELIFALAILGALVTVASSALTDLGRRTALRCAAGRFQAVLAGVRDEAGLLDRFRGVRFFQTPSGWGYSVYEDGDLDGVRNDDIRSGVDRLVAGPNLLLDAAGGIGVGIPALGITHPDTRALMTPQSAPVNFNGSSICSFAPDGDGTPGTIYLTDGTDTAAVRCAGNGGRVYILLYDRRGKTWAR